RGSPSPTSAGSSDTKTPQSRSACTRIGCQTPQLAEALIALMIRALHWNPVGSRWAVEPVTAVADCPNRSICLGTSGEPEFRELEPDWQMAQTGGGASRRCLIGVDDASRLGAPR